MSDEFENREFAQYLSELPAGISRERGEREGYTDQGSRFDHSAAGGLYGRRSPGGQAPVDVYQQNRVQNMPGEMGSPEIGFDVRSTYDARPVNARDFIEQLTLTFAIDACGANPTITGTFEVPNGYTAVLKGFKYQVDPLYKLNSDDSILVSILAEGVPVANFTDLRLPGIVNEFIPCYILAAGTKTLGIRMFHPVPTNAGTNPPAKAYVTFYGQYLLSRGLPTQYEPTNRAR